MARDLSALRESYQRAGLRRAVLAPDPIAQFEHWWDEWQATKPYDAAACVIATVDPDGQPSARFVLCRGFDLDGFVIYTNQASRKGRDLAANPRASLVFGWLELARQVRVEGTVKRVSRAESEAYFRTRPVASQVGAWASAQSSVIAGRDELERREAELAEGFGPDGPVPLPEFWGGYRVIPTSVEFWQGRPSRLHDRLRYLPDGQGWKIDRLAP